MCKSVNNTLCTHEALASSSYFFCDRDHHHFNIVSTPIFFYFFVLCVTQKVSEKQWERGKSYYVVFVNVTCIFSIEIKIDHMGDHKNGIWNGYKHKVTSINLKKSCNCCNKGKRKFPVFLKGQRYLRRLHFFFVFLVCKKMKG